MSTETPRVVWLGPVASSQVHAPSSDLFVQCVGTAGTPICADTDLGTVLPQKGIAADQPIILHGFSAGGDAIKRYLKDQAARARTVAVVTHDATYQGFGSDEGYYAYGAEAALAAPGHTIFVATASSPPGSNLRGGISDSASMDALRQQVEQRTGQTFQPIEAPWAPKPPVKALQLGNVLLFDFGTAYSHGEHATVLGPLVIKNVVEPLLAGDVPVGALPAATPTPPPVPSSAAPVPETPVPGVPMAGLGVAHDAPAMTAVPAPVSTAMPEAPVPSEPSEEPSPEGGWTATDALILGSLLFGIGAVAYAASTVVRS